MATATKEPRSCDDLFRLVQYVGWSHRQSGAQVVIYPPEPGSNPPRPGEGFVTMNLRNGDFRSFDNSRTRLKRAGLFEAVTAKKAIEDAVARADVQRQREEAEKTITAINNAAAVSEGDDMGRDDSSTLHALADRCRAVGWSVKQIGTNGSHLIITPTGRTRPITVAVSSTVAKYPEMILAKLTKAGLLDAEADRGIAVQPTLTTASTAVNDTAPTDTDDDTDGPEISGGQQTGPVPGGLTEVEGIEIAEWAYALTPVKALDKKATELLLADGQIRYGCIRGDFTGKTWQSVAKHRGPAHPELRGKGAVKRAEVKAAVAAELAAAPASHDDVYSEDVTAPLGPVIDIKTRPAPAALFQPATDAGEHNRQRLAELLGSAQTAEKAEARRVTPAPAAARAKIAEVAKAPVPAVWPVPTPASTTTVPAPAAPSTSGGVAVSLQAGGAVAMADMVARFKQLAGAEAELAALRDEVNKLKAELSKANARGTALADECVTKDHTIKRMRERIAADADTVKAATELQQLMNTLMGGSRQIAA